MFRYKSLKKSFVMTALVILLCLACLVGSTLALFTSNPSDGTIGIVTTSGDVEIDIVDTDGKTLQNRALSFMITSENKNETKKVDSHSVFLEPGAMFYTEGFRITNEGDIPVKYRLNFNEEGILDKDNNVVTLETLLETFEIKITTNPSDPTKTVDLENFNPTLDVDKESDIYFLVIKMKESVDNNFQNQTYSGIGITVYAVQSNAVQK